MGGKSKEGTEWKNEYIGKEADETRKNKWRGQQEQLRRMNSPSTNTVEQDQFKEVCEPQNENPAEFSLVL